MAEIITNKVAESGLYELNLENYFPKENIAVFDLKEFLFMGLILKEKEFREALKQHDFSLYRDQYLAVTCSADAIIPMWAYMLVAAYAQPYAVDVIAGDLGYVQKQLLLQKIRGIDLKGLEDKRVVIKGCGDLPIGDFAYLEITKLLRPVVKSIMYGEPCSTVPVYKKPK